MPSLDIIKSRLLTLYKTQPNIHINVSIPNPKVCLKNQSVVLKGVYPHIFQIEEKSTGLIRRHTFQYTDLLTGRIEIAELTE